MRNILRLPWMYQPYLRSPLLFDLVYILLVKKGQSYATLSQWSSFADSSRPLEELHSWRKAVSLLTKDFTDNDWSFYEALADSNEVITFLRGVLGEDILLCCVTILIL